MRFFLFFYFFLMFLFDFICVCVWHRFVWLHKCLPFFIHKISKKCKKKIVRKKFKKLKISHQNTSAILIANSTAMHDIHKQKINKKIKKYKTVHAQAHLHLLLSFAFFAEVKYLIITQNTVIYICYKHRQTQFLKRAHKCTIQRKTTTVKKNNSHIETKKH